MIERDFDVAFVAALAQREKQAQQHYRPLIGIHKWFARRPGTLFRALLLSEFVPGPLAETFYRGHRLDGLTVADPFMGGGTCVMEANRLGCEVVAGDINPMAWWIVRQELASLDLEAYRDAARTLRRRLEKRVGALYRTRCTICDSHEAEVKSFLWVKTLVCEGCGGAVDLFPSYLVAADGRHPGNVLVCAECAALTETTFRSDPGPCSRCGLALRLEGPARRNRCTCRRCGTLNRYPKRQGGPPTHRLITVEYHCRTCKRGHNGRFFKAPDAADVAKGAEAEAQWRATIPRFVPDEAILAGDETSRLLRWGYTHWRDLFLPRQLLGLEASAAFIADLPAGPVREALATNLSDLVRYQNLLCRYDTRTLKVLDTFSVHGFPVGLVQAEANLLGVPSEGGGNVGSGGWSNIVEKYTKAKTYCKAPFEVREEGGRRVRVFIPGERIGAHEAHIGDEAVHRAGLFCRDAAHAEYASASIDAVLTDPPYLGNVQYAELIDFCYVWLRRLVGPDVPGFAAPSTRRLEELTANATQGRGLVSFTGGLSRAFRKAALGLKPGGPFVFTYHHNAQEAYVPVAVALLDAGLVCTACLPCPGEMAASLHIRGTASSTVDTVFVCRSCESTLGESHLLSVQSPTEEAARDADRLRKAGMELTPGDLRCLRFGHLTRLAVRHLIAAWDCSASVERRLASVQDWMAGRLSTGSSGGKRMESGAESHEAPTDQGVGSEACVSGAEAA